jgi:rhamnogalacturonyl hydrolase YesR
VVTGFIAAGATKLLWRRELAGIGWGRLGGWASAAMAAVLTLGLVIFGHDGKMVTYAAMVVACALALWWVGFRHRG